MTMSRDEIFNELKRQFIELFEVPAEKITLDAKLYDDLDLDSIDAVDMVVQLQKQLNKRFKPDDFKNVRTVKDVVDAVENLLAKS